MPPFYFSYADAGEAFSPSAHLVEDEEVVRLEIAHTEKEFPRALVTLKNPRTGLLRSGRKRWIWISYDDGGTAGAVPVFFGRIAGIPQDLQDEAVTVELIARPGDYEAQRQALADTLKVAPFWDPVWIAPERREDPEAVLDARSQLWHVDRVSHDLTVSDIIEGEDGTADFAGGFFYDSLSVTYTQPPARRVQVDAEVYWDQQAVGSVDLTQALVNAFQAAGTSKPHVASSFTGQGLADDWPEKGDRIGAGWRVGTSSLVRADGRAVIPDQATAILFNGTTADFPLWTFHPVLNADYEVTRSRSEKLSFTVEMDCQELFAEAGDEEVVRLALSTASLAELLDAADSDNPDGTAPIGDSRRRQYFTTDRGKQSFEYLLMLARAHGLARARAVQIDFEVSFADGLDLSCRKMARIADTRLPGGEATGKIIGYTLIADPDAGKMMTQIRIGCAIGTGSTVSAAAGTPDYAEDGYVEAGYQTRSGAVIVPGSGGVGYTDYGDTEADDDGIDFLNFPAADAIQSLSVINGETVQRSVLGLGWNGMAEAAEQLNLVYTEVDLVLKPLNTGPFETIYEVTATGLAAPRQIDLEAA